LENMTCRIRNLAVENGDHLVCFFSLHAGSYVPDVTQEDVPMPVLINQSANWSILELD